MSTEIRSAPKSALGYVNPELERGLGIGNLPDWGDWDLDKTEYVAPLKWPQSIVTYNKMRSDPQIEGLLRGMTLPIRRFAWSIEPDGAKVKTANEIAEDMHLRVHGKKRNPKWRSNDFNFDNFLLAALSFLVYGHAWFEKAGDIVDGLWRMNDLEPRMQDSIDTISISRDGQLEWLKQREEYEPPKLKLPTLVPFSFEREGANWFGRSLLRSAYQPWLLKDRLLRVDAIRHERNGMGVPIVELPERATEEQRKEAVKLANQYRTGMASGGALPFGMKLRLVGVEGATSDVLSSIRYHDEAMAKLMLQMFTQLGMGGSDSSGSKALGEVFVKFFSQAQDAVADFFADVVNKYLIEPWVIWNYGPDEAPPKLTYARDEDPELSAHELAQLVAQNVVTVDTELENFLREKYGLIQLKGERPKPEEFGLPPAPGAGKPAPPDEGEPNDNVGEPPPERPASDKQASAHMLGLTTRFRRDVTTVEAQSGTDFHRLQESWEQAVREAISIFVPVREEQIEELAEATNRASSVTDLAKITATAGGADDLTLLLNRVANDAVEAAITELVVQGRTVVTRPSPLDMTATAEATADIMARSLGASAARIAGTVGTGAIGADAVRAWGSRLSSAYIEETAGAALSAAQNAGRFAVYALERGPVNVFASEIMDANTCPTCADVDGKQYASLEEGLADYPNGQYVRCNAGPRCRGTLVFVAG